MLDILNDFHMVSIINLINFILFTHYKQNKMDIIDLEIKQRSSKMDTLKEQLRQMEEEQHKSEQVRKRELQEQKQNMETDSTIQDLEDMVMRDLSYNVPITYIDDTNGRVYSAIQTYVPSPDHKIKQTTLFDYKKRLFS